MTRELAMEKLKESISLKLRNLFDRMESNNPELSFDDPAPGDITVEPEHIEITITGKNRTSEKKKIFPVVLLNFSDKSLAQLEKEIKSSLL